jgi:hypothetical protein
MRHGLMKKRHKSEEGYPRSCYREHEELPPPEAEFSIKELMQELRKLSVERSGPVRARRWLRFPYVSVHVIVGSYHEIPGRPRAAAAAAAAVGWGIGGGRFGECGGVLDRLLGAPPDRVGAAHQHRARDTAGRCRGRLGSNGW